MTENTKLPHFLMKASAALLLLVCAAFLSYADDTPRLAPSPYVLKSYGDGENITVDDAIRYSLLFSGVTEDSLSEYEARLVTFIGDFGKVAQSAANEKELSEKALYFLHTKALKQYSENQTLVDVALSTGKYNCVSSAVLYMILAQSAGIRVMGVKTTDHVFCRVQADGDEYDVETTNQYGFDPGSKKDFIDSFGNVTGFSYVSPANYKKRKDITASELITVILHNRVSYLEKSNKYKEAVGLAVDAFAFSGDDDSHDILFNTIVNVGAWYNSKMHFDEGIQFFDAAIARFGHSPKFDEVLHGLSNNKVARLLDTKKLIEAQSFIDDRQKRGFLSDDDFLGFSVNVALVQADELSRKSYADAVASANAALEKLGADPRLAKMKGSLVNNWIASLINGKKPDEALKVISDLHEKKDLDDKDFVEFSSLAYQQKALDVAKAKGDLEAAQFTLDVMATLGNVRALSAMHDQFISSFEIKTHNRIATLVNSKKYSEAKKEALDALALLPGSKKIKDDLDKVEKILGN